MANFFSVSGLEKWIEVDVSELDHPDVGHSFEQDWHLHEAAGGKDAQGEIVGLLVSGSLLNRDSLW